ncbi:MAG: hypothetical protein R6U96_12410 [Promethearchaeia archaeon]
MSKKKKKRAAGTVSKEISEKDIEFEMILQFAGWICLIALVGFLGVWGLFDYILEIIEIELNNIIYAYLLFTGTSCAFCFALETKVKKERDKKKQFFVDWMITEFFLCMFAIFSVAVYQW